MKKLAQFLKNSSGNVAMTTAICILPIFTAVGAAVDYSNYVNMRSAVQNAIDAAGLAAARELEDNPNVSEASLKTYAETFFESNIPARIDEDEYTFNLSIKPGDQSVEPPIPDQIQISADIVYDTIFGGKFFVDTIEEEVLSLVSLGNRTVEIALVLDNSGSMGGNRIATLRTEAKNLVDTIFNSANFSTLEDPVKFSLVPFAGTVNVGTNNKNKNWMDKKGWSPVHYENFDWSTYRTNNATRTRKKNGFPYGFQEQINGSWKWKTRHDVFEMVGVEWGGCVEMRPWPHNVLDTYVPANQNYNGASAVSVDTNDDGVPDESPGTNALFVPYFAPDEPDHRFAEDYKSGYNEYWFAQNTDHDPDDDYYPNNYLYDFHDYNPNSPSNPIQLYADDNSGNPAYDLYDYDKQVNRTNFMFKYQVNRQYVGSLGYWRGPNDGCTTQPITELSTNRQLIKDKIDEMGANGTTNIQQGLTWGWRTVSPGEPFTGGREKEERRNMKFVVLLSDGNNFYSTDGDSTPNNTAYGAWGYARPDSHDLKNAFNGTESHNRWIEGLESADLAGTIYTTTSFDMTPESYGDFEKIMNAHTNQACNNIKADGVTIYTVAFDVPSSGGVRDLLEACAGSGIKEGELVVKNGTFYYDVDEGGLEDAFANIARQIANLRISG